MSSHPDDKNGSMFWGIDHCIQGKTNPPANAVSGTKPPPPPAGRLSQQMPVVQAAAPAKKRPEGIGEGLGRNRSGSAGAIGDDSPDGQGP